MTFVRFSYNAQKWVICPENGHLKNRTKVVEIYFFPLPIPPFSNPENTIMYTKTTSDYEFCNVISAGIWAWPEAQARVVKLF